MSDNQYSTFEEQIALLDNKTRELLAERRLAASIGAHRTVKKIDGALAQIDLAYRAIGKHLEIPADDMPSDDDDGIGAGDGAWRSLLLMVLAIVGTYAAMAVL